jgi:superfamily II DNA or RNA helicase
MTIALRDYQSAALGAIQSEFQNGVCRQLISLPTGGGKTIVMSAVAKTFNTKTLLIAHRQELLFQAEEKLKLFWPEADIGFCKSERNEIDSQIVIASVQTACRLDRLALLKEKGFGLMMIDEAHHSVADSYQKIIEGLGFRAGSGKLLLGVSATIDREGLGTVFDKIPYSISIGTLIKAGYLSPVVGRRILTNLTLERIRIQNGDFSQSELSQAINTPERNRFIVEKYKEYGSDRKTIAFCCDVQHCHDLEKAFKEAGISAASVWGDMASDDRQRVLTDLKNGSIQVAISCGVLTEGFDESSVACIVMARPTKSKTLFTQAVGRGLRKHVGKENCLILDFTDKGHNLDSVIKLSDAIPESHHLKEEFESEEEIDKVEIDRTPKIRTVQECDQEFDVLGSSRFIWIPIDDNEWSLIDDERREIVISPEGVGYIAEIYFQDGTSFSIVKKAIPLEYCQGLCEDYARKHLKIAFADFKSPWMMEHTSPTKGQIEFLQKNNAYSSGMSKAKAAVEIRKVIALKNKKRRRLSKEPISQKQMFFLQSRGINASKMTKFQAMQAIAKYKSQVEA